MNTAQMKLCLLPVLYLELFISLVKELFSERLNRFSSSTFQFVSQHSITALTRKTDSTNISDETLIHYIVKTLSLPEILQYF